MSQTVWSPDEDTVQGHAKRLLERANDMTNGWTRERRRQVKLKVKRMLNPPKPGLKRKLEARYRIGEWTVRIWRYTTVKATSYGVQHSEPEYHVIATSKRAIMTPNGLRDSIERGKHGYDEYTDALKEALAILERVNG